MKKVSLIIALGLLSVRIANAEGTSSASFLQMGAGARAAAMGESYVSVANDATATYWNPAGVARVDETQISAMQNTHVVDTSYQHLAAVKPFGRFGVGLAIARMDYGSIDRYTVANVKDGNFTANSLAAGVSLAGRIGDDISVGGTLKMIRESIESESANAMAADLGFLYDINGFTMGAIGAEHRARHEDGARIVCLADDRSAGRFHPSAEQQNVGERRFQQAERFRGGASNGVGIQSRLILHAARRLQTHLRRFRLGRPGGRDRRFWSCRFERFNLDYAATPFGDLGISRTLVAADPFLLESSHSY